MKFLLAIFLVTPVLAADLVDKIVAIVGNETVLESDIRATRSKLSKGNMFDPLLLKVSSDPTANSDKKDILKLLINERILDSEIKRLKLNVTSERVDREISAIAQSQGGTKAQLLQEVKNHGMSVSSYQDQVKQNIERATLIGQEVTSKINITEDEITSEYLKKQGATSIGVVEYTIAHIYFNAKKGGTEETLQRAESVLAKLRRGENFDSLAEQNSEDPNFTTGGLLGSFKAGEFSKDLEDAVKNLSQGEYSGVVKSKGGIHILKLISKKVVNDPKYEKSREPIRGQLLEQRLGSVYQAWLNQKHDEVFIRINE